jgi:hypothetical protein
VSDRFWTPEFRAWLNAYLFDGLEDEQRLAELDAAARRAGEAARQVARRAGRCPECGRPWNEWDAFVDLLESLDAA